MEWIGKKLLFSVVCGTVVYVLYQVAKLVAVPIDAALPIPQNLHAVVPLALFCASSFGLFWIVPRRLLDTESRRALLLIPTRSLVALAAAFMLAFAAVVAYTAVHPRIGSSPSIVLGLLTLYCAGRVVTRVRRDRKPA